MAELVIMYWRDIPVQVIVKEGRRTARRHLGERFENAVDMAALKANLKDSDAYLEEWRRGEPQPCGDDLEAEAQAAQNRLMAAYSDERLLRLMRNGALEPEA